MTPRKPRPLPSKVPTAAELRAAGMAAQRLADERRRHPGIGSPGISKGRKIGAH